MGLWLVSEFRQFYLEQVTDGLVRQALLTEALVRQNTLPVSLEDLAQQVGAAGGTRVTFIAPDGTVLGESERDAATLENHADRPEVMKALQGETGVDTRESVSLGSQLLYAAVPVRDRNGNIVFVSRLALDLSQVNQSLARIRLLTLTGGLVALFIGLMLSLANAQGVSEPLQAMVAVANKLSRGDLSTRAARIGPKETIELAQALNIMAGNLEQEFARVRVSNEKLEAVLSSMRDGVVLLTEDETIELINRAAADMLGLQSEITGGHDSLLERYPDLYGVILRVKKEGNALAERIGLGGGAARQIRAAVLPLESGKLLITLQDITEVYRAIDIRRDFVANVSHELRTPLTSLGIMIENLQRGAVNDKEVANDFLERMSGEIERLTKMVVELLQLSRLEGGSEAIAPTSFTALGLVTEVLSGLEGQLSSKGQTVALEGEVGLSIYADRAKLKQVLINLVDNAAKFSPEGSNIVVGLRDLASEVEIYVQDNGPGIAPEHIPRVYERFFKASSSRGGGTGLGLAIVKHIIEAHNGSVYVRSRMGQGATFGVYLPKKAQGI